MCVQFDARKKLLSCARPLEWPFELDFTEQILKILEDNSEHFRGFWETLFESERAKESPEIYFRPKSFRTIFKKQAPVYSLAAPLLGMAKSIYYTRTAKGRVLNVEFEEWCEPDVVLSRLSSRSIF